MAFGGYATGAYVATTEKWSGTAWATTGSLSEAKHALAGCGTTSAALAFGGYTNAYVATTEIWTPPPVYTFLEDTKAEAKAVRAMLEDAKIETKAVSISRQDLKYFADAVYPTVREFTKTDIKTRKQAFECLKTFIGEVNYDLKLFDLKTDIRASGWFRSDLKTEQSADWLYGINYLKTDIRAAKWSREDLKTFFSTIYGHASFVKAHAAATYLPDTTPPYVERFPNPYDGYTNVKRDAPVMFYIKDIGWGVDIDSVWVKINGVKYQKGDSAFSYIGSPNSYKITVRPTADWMYNQTIIVKIFGKDLAGNPGLDLEPA